ncbi:protein kinase [Ideonella sp. 4Y16]|uniref:serine/threonine-protein kinase n=1 Tax=Ideonella alba TaxID=2824118 RepID=UPI001B392D13|nr:serine/threonine-protein kinase [Ideonella alba]MBQ0942183.1 protein kinase [Ideonella alba]
MAPRSTPWSGLDAPSWQRLRSLLDQALALPVPDRTAWLAALPADAADLREPLQRLLTLGDDEADRLNALPSLAAAGPEPLASGDLVGPYRLLRPLGQGGMAEVWLAEHLQLLQGRQVALKLPFAQSWRSGLAERFARERAILATLAHPNIARLYDAGVDDRGRPWLALELVQGQPLDLHCQQAGLDVPARIGLMLQVMDAVAYAHASLVVHRDLKPGNILVSAEGQVRLLDFGIARLLEDGVAEDSELTRELGRALTVPYAAPEQLSGGAIGTAADVYSLGVVLFELLCGSRPYRLDRGTRGELEQAVLHGEPRRASEAAATPALRRALRGDLDTILATALQKDPRQRYASVDAFADDLHRHLQHLPLRARPEPWWVLLRKAVWRHRVASAAVAATTLAVLGGAGAAWWQAEEARAQRDAALAARERADREAESARRAEHLAAAQADLSSFVLSDFAGRHADEEMVKQLESALLMVRAQYRDDPGLRGALLLGVGEQFRWISEQGRANEVFDEAAPLLQQHGDAGALAQLMCIRAAMQAMAGQSEAAQALLKQAQALNPQQSTGQLTAQAECLLEEALMARIAGQPGQAVALIGQALDLQQRAGLARREAHSEALNALARAQLEAGQHADAVHSTRRSIALLDDIGRANTPGLRNAWGVLASALREGGQARQAEAAHRGEGRFSADEGSQPLPVRMELAVTWSALGQWRRAAQALEQLADEALRQEAPGNARFSLVYAGRARLALGEVAAARRDLARAEVLVAAARRAGRPQARSVLMLAIDVALAEGQLDQAQALLDETATLLQRTAATTPHVWSPWHRSRAALAWRRGDLDQALQAAETVLELARAHAIDAQASVGIAEGLWLRAQLRQARGDTPGAREDARLARQHLEAAAGPAHPLIPVIERL